jgi:dipeptidyl aminopeptidase/acylaminoacyl peptidase
MRRATTTIGVAVLWALATGEAVGGDVPDSIVTEEVPAVSAELKARLRPYQNARPAAFVGWVGGRREILIRTRFAETEQIHRVAFPGGARTQLTFFANTVIGAKPNPTNPAFAFGADEGGVENYQIFVQDDRTGLGRRLTDGTSRNILFGWSRTGRSLGFSSNARNDKDMDIYVAEPGAPGAPRRLKEVAGNWLINDWSPDDRQITAVELISGTESYVHLIDVATGDARTLTPRPTPRSTTVFHIDVRFAPDGQSLFWTTDLDSEFRRLARFDLATGRMAVLTAAIPWDVEGYDLSDDGRTIVLVANEDGLSRLHVLDQDTGRERPAPALPAGRVSGLKFLKGSQEFGFTLDSAKAPGDVYSYDLSSMRLERWTASETGGLDPAGFAEPEVIRYPSFDGRPIPALVYRPSPKFTGPRPVLVYIHGGPDDQYRPGYLYQANYLIEELGIAIVLPNVRGSYGYGKSYLKLDDGVAREDAVKDIGALLEWIKRQPGLDASRIAVSGGSYGGFMALATMVRFSDRLKCGIDSAGMSNFITFLKGAPDYHRGILRNEYGDERDPAIRAYLERISPLTNAAKIAIPILVSHGQNDPRVPVAEAEQILAAVRKTGRSVWYVLAKDEGHGFARRVNQDYLQAIEVLFLTRHLLGNKPGS